MNYIARQAPLFFNTSATQTSKPQDTCLLTFVLKALSRKSKTLFRDVFLCQRVADLHRSGRQQIPWSRYHSGVGSQAGEEIQQKCQYGLHFINVFVSDLKQGLNQACR